MLNTNVSNFRKNIFGILEQTVKYNEPVNVSTKEGNAIILSEDDYHRGPQHPAGRVPAGN